MNNQRTTTIDLNDYLKRLSFLATVPAFSTNQIKTDDDVEDYDETDEEDDEDSNKVENSLNFKSDIVYEVDENQDDESNNTLIIKNNGLFNDHNQVKPKENEYYEDFIDKTNGKKTNGSLNLNLNLPSMEASVLEPISIKTDFTYSVDNQQSPRSQLFELALELEKEREEKNKLKVELSELKQSIKEQYQVEIENLKEENKTLKDELNYSQRLIKELKESSQLSKNHFSQIDSLRYENQKLNERMVETQTANSQLNQQVKQLQRYEALFKGYEFLQVNNKCYQIISKIGQGGFSSVYHCVLHKVFKSYALKKVDLSNLESGDEKLVMNEIELLKKLQSTNKVIQLFEYEYNKEKKQLNLIMELGSTDLSAFFKKEIQKHNCVKEPTRMYYWIKMLEAVAAVHKEGVIHSDIKPGNFLVVGCEVKLIDFNISNTISDRTSITLTNDCGTLNYMAPETLLRDSDTKTKINQKVDVWALGVILYYITYGRLPLQHIKNQYKLMHSLCDPLQKEFKFEPLEDKDLKDTIESCFCFDPNKRLSVNELLVHPYITSKNDLISKTKNKKSCDSKNFV